MRNTIDNRDECLAYYSDLYGERWKILYASLLKEKQYIDLVAYNTDTLPASTCESNTAKSNTIAASYFIDYASMTIAQIISEIIIENNYRAILDMCAAPGGKALVMLRHHLASIKHSLEGYLSDPLKVTINDKSRNRFLRLQQNIRDYFITPCTEANYVDAYTIELSNIHGALFGKHHPNTFDMVIADVPCSNSKHIFQDDTLLAQWNKKKYTRLASDQFALLCAAVDSCRNGGMIMYITCSINPIENELCIARLQKKRTVEVLTINNDILKKYTQMVFEPAEFGYYILPDTSNGTGPLYVCLIQKCH